MKLLLISNSASPGEGYLEKPAPYIQEFLSSHDIQNILFIPYAAVTFSYDEYVSKVNTRFQNIGYKVKGIHQYPDPIKAIDETDAIVVGGGNTFMLSKKLQENQLIEPIQRKVKQGIPYIGWSAGSNIACPTICTTNDMPIVCPVSFDVFSFIPFQINPHYLDSHPVGHGGETREQRILEYISANRDRYVVGLREGCLLRYEDGQLSFVGDKTLRLFHYGEVPKELTHYDDINFLMNPKYNED